MNPLRQLQDLGQSYWLDNLTRGMIQDGSLERRVTQEGLRGITTNPVIFHKAIAAGTDYDEQIAEGYAGGLTAEQIYESIVTSDVRNACDILRPVYERTEGVDGYVSLEVSPHLARNTRRSIEEAKHLHQVVDRPNLLIKIPGTPEGVPAIEQLLVDGIGVNITLLFSIPAYEAVVEAYARALERRLADGLSVERTVSVASFFLSRIDRRVDRLLDDLIDGESEAAGSDPRPQDLLGRAAVANAKLAYHRFREFVGSSRARALGQQGARPQRLVWASTSTKNPKYRDVMYVEPLIGPHTVNTMPDATIQAFADHGRAAATLQEGIEEAQQVMVDLERLGIDMHAVTEALVREGIDAFVQPYDALLALIGSKMPSSVATEEHVE